MHTMSRPLQARMVENGVRVLKTHGLLPSVDPMCMDKIAAQEE